MMKLLAAYILSAHLAIVLLLLYLGTRKDVELPEGAVAGLLVLVALLGLVGALAVLLLG